MESTMTAQNSRVIDQFGAETMLWHPSTATMASAEDVLSDKVVVLYFSAHWCPPCKRFTPLLRTIYEKLRAKQALPAGLNMDDFEFVYCSMDNYNAEYRSYTSNMPWWCLPHQSPVVNKLRNFYKAEGIPYLCVVDKDGDLLCGDAVNEAMEDTAGERFPWRCAQHIEEIVPDTYVKNDGSYNPTSELDGKYLMFYFCAKWCNRSTIFTKKLVRGYRALKRVRDDFEILFVSSDRDRKSFKDNFNQMPFGAIPYGDRYAKNKLTKFLGIRGIPALLIFGPKPVAGGFRPLLNPNIRDFFERGDYINDFPYLPSPFGDINATKEDINTHRFIIIFHEAGDDMEQDEIKEAIKSASDIYEASGGKPIKLCYAFSTSGLCESLRSVLRLGVPKDEPTMVLLDIPDSGAYYVCPQGVELTQEVILGFTKTPGQRQQI